MPKTDAISRREWFRLRTRPTNTDTADLGKTVGDQSIGLTPIEHPPNYDGMDLSELPPMREALLTSQQVEDLFTDIAEVATDIMLMQRSGAESRASASKADSSRSLQVARNALLSREISRVQIRYRWQDRLWIDTLESSPPGYRIVRIAHRV